MKVILAALFLCVILEGVAQAQRPNIVVFLSDDHGLLDSTVYPEFYFTTHIDLGQAVDGAEYFASWREKAKTNAAAAALVQRYHERPAEELYDLRADSLELTNLAGDPHHAQRLAAMRADVDAWMKANNDEAKVYGEPRLSSDPDRAKPPPPAKERRDRP